MHQTYQTKPAQRRKKNSTRASVKHYNYVLTWININGDPLTQAGHYHSMPSNTFQTYEEYHGLASGWVLDWAFRFLFLV